MEYVTLVAVDQITPYNKGDVFTVTKKEADLLLNPVGKTDEKGNQLPVKVEQFDPDSAEHRALLDAQRGKPTDPHTGKDLEQPAEDAGSPNADEKAKAEKPKEDAAKK